MKGDEMQYTIMVSWDMDTEVRSWASHLVKPCLRKSHKRRQWNCRWWSGQPPTGQPAGSSCCRWAPAGCSGPQTRCYSSGRHWSWFSCRGCCPSRTWSSPSWLACSCQGPGNCTNAELPSSQLAWWTSRRGHPHSASQEASAGHTPYSPAPGRSVGHAGWHKLVSLSLLSWFWHSDHRCPDPSIPNTRVQFLWRGAGYRPISRWIHGSLCSAQRLLYCWARQGWADPRGYTCSAVPSSAIWARRQTWVSWTCEACFPFLCSGVQSASVSGPPGTAWTPYPWWCCSHICALSGTVPAHTGNSPSCWVHTQTHPSAWHPRRRRQGRHLAPCKGWHRSLWFRKGTWRWGTPGNCGAQSVCSGWFSRSAPCWAQLLFHPGLQQTGEGRDREGVDEFRQCTCYSEIKFPFIMKWERWINFERTVI